MTLCSFKGRQVMTLVAHTFLVLLLFIMVMGCTNDGSSNSGSPDLAGLVVDETLAGAEIKVFGPNNSTPVGLTITGESGQFSFNLPEREYYMLEARGGEFDNGTAFEGTMKGIYLPGKNVCSISPLSTLAVDLYKSEDYDLTPGEALREAKRAMGLEPDLTDPFLLEAFANKTVKRDLEKLMKDTGKLTAELQQVQKGIDNNATGKTEFRYIAELNHVRRQIDAGKGLSQWVGNMTEFVSRPFYNNTAGHVQLDKMLTDASVSMVRNGRSKELGTTDNSGYWQSESKMKVLEPFRLEVSGGITDAADTAQFNGTLSAYVPYRNSWHLDNSTVDLKNLNVNILTTIIDRYMQHSDTGYYTALHRVKSFFNIPEELDPTKIDNSNYNYSFFPSEFMKRSQEDANFDSYVDSLVMRIDSGSSVDMKPVSNEFGYQIVQATLSQKLWDGVVGGIGSGAAGFALNTAAYYVLPAMGIESHRHKVENQLNEIHDQLEGIDHKVEEIKKRIGGVFASIEWAKQKTFQQIVASDVNTNLKWINNHYDTYCNIVNGTSDIELEGFMKDHVDMFDMMSKIKSIKDDVFTPPDTEYKPGMEAMLDEWVQKIKKGKTTKEKGKRLEIAYMHLKNYFDNITSHQFKAAVLYMNKKYWKSANENNGDLPDNINDKVYQDIQEKFGDIMQRQIELFVTYVERLVTASANVRTDLAKGENMFHRDSVRKVFRDADLIAQQILSNDTAAFVTRVVGTPETTQSYGAPDQSSSKIKGISGSDFVEKTRISIAGEKIRDYNAPTEDYPSDYYLSFSNNKDNGIDGNIKYAENIYFTQFYFDKVNSALNEYLNENKVLDFTWNLAYSDPAYSAEVEFDTIKSNVAKGNETKHHYGHLTIFARNIPIDLNELIYSRTIKTTGRGVRAREHDQSPSKIVVEHESRNTSNNNILSESLIGLVLDLSRFKGNRVQCRLAFDYNCYASRGGEAATGMYAVAKSKYEYLKMTEKIAQDDHHENVIFNLKNRIGGGWYDYDLPDPPTEKITSSNNLLKDQKHQAKTFEIRCYTNFRNQLPKLLKAKYKLDIKRFELIPAN